MFVTKDGEKLMMKSVSNVITTHMKQVLAKLKKGDLIEFDFIYYINPTGKRIKAPPFKLIIN